MGIMDTLPSQSNFFTTYFPFRSTTTNTLLRPSSLFNLRKPRPSSSSSSSSSSSFLSLSSASPPPRSSTGFHTNTSDNNNPDPNNPICWAAFLRILTHTVKKSVAFFSLDDQEEYYGGKCFLQIGIGIGAGGVALLTATTTALALNNNKALKFIISPFVATLAANRTFVSGLLAWFAAQSMKVLLHFFLEKRWDLRFYLASGGMPSSHSALCTALTSSVALCHGVADSLFPVCLGFTSIVMYDAIGVRRHAGMQAEVLNMIVEDLFQGHPISQRKLKELLGHTPSQVFAGALLGIIIACICCRGCLVANPSPKLI